MLFCGKNAQSHRLPPSKDVLRKHIQRANYQTAVWRNSLVGEPQIPSPNEHGWIVTGEEITVYWMEQPAAPKALLELIICGCTSTCNVWSVPPTPTSITILVWFIFFPMILSIIDLHHLAWVCPTFCYPCPYNCSFDRKFSSKISLSISFKLKKIQTLNKYFFNYPYYTIIIFSIAVIHAL